MTDLSNAQQNGSQAFPMKLGIACVYFYGEEGDWLLDLQLQYIASTTVDCDYKIYAGANRLQPALRKRLASTARVEIVDLPHFDGHGSREHSFYLDKLLWHAAIDGCTHIAALDSDSFPVLRGWSQHLAREMGSSTRFAAVLRAENNDSYLPHPCGYFMCRSFLLECRPSLYPPSDDLSSHDFQRFLRATRQRVDTGIGYGYELWNRGEQWLRLLRSNRHDPHFLMAGIYHDIFFHLGAGSRRPAFHADRLTDPWLRLEDAVCNLPVIWRIAPHLHERYLVRNERTVRSIIQGLRSDPDQFLAMLRADKRGR